MRVTFGDFTIDTDERRVMRRGEEAHVSPKALAFLELILDRRPAAVSREEIYECLWPKTFVSESNLASIAAEVRQALGDDARKPRYLRTVFGFGYAFIGEEGHESASRAKARLVTSSGELPLIEGATTLGRDTPILSLDDAVSREHARVLVTGDRVTIEDLGSKNGTYVGGKRIAHSVDLADGDEITIGRTHIILRTKSDPGSTVTLHAPSKESAR
jgi:DNA-binding winged helix-turn-helix (wHTH) protein